MKKIFLFIYAFILLVSVFLIVYAKGIKHTKQNNEYDGFVFEDSLIAFEKIIQGKYNSDVDKNVILFLSTHCDYCTSVLSSLISNAKNIAGKHQVLLVFNEPGVLVKRYIQNFPIKALQNTIIYSDSTRLFNNYFKIKTTPSIFVINNKRVIENAHGSDKIISIIKELR